MNEIADIRSKITALEGHIKNLPQVDLPPVHRFVKGLYAREITIPADVVLTGKIHKYEHLNFLMKGEISVWTENGMKRLIAPAIIPSQPGTKRVGYAHTETVWVTVHATEETDPDKAEEALTCMTHEEFLDFVEKERFLLEAK